jgi:cytochrome P450
MEPSSARKIDFVRPTLGDLFDPLAPDQIEDPYPLYAQARREEPVFFSRKLNAWVVTRYRDLTAVLRDTVHFSSVGSLESQPELAPEVQAILDTGYREFLSLVQSDPPDHTRIRHVFNKAFAAPRLAALEPYVREVATSLIDSFIKEGEVDIVDRFAFPLPGAVICRMLGVPRSDIEQLKTWSNAKQILLVGKGSKEQLVTCAHQFIALQRYFQGHLERRAQKPQDDLLTLLVPIEIGGKAPLSMQEAVCNAIDLLAAGHETTTDLIGNGLALLMAHPAQMAELRADSSLIPAALDEILRIEAPVRGLFRRVTSPILLGGVKLPVGARLFLLYGSGNHDEAQFEDGDTFNIRRVHAAQHLSFGKGLHFCVGSILAKLEGSIAFELLLQRLPNLRRHATLPSERRPYVILRGFEHLPVQWDAPARR